MSFRSHLQALPRWQKALISVSLAIALYAAIGFLALPPIARDQALVELRTTVHRDATVGEVRINPFLLTLDIEAFALPDRDGSPFVSFDALHADFELSSIWNGAFTFREIRLTDPFVHVKILDDGALNFGDIIETLLAESGDEADAGEEALPAVLIQLARIESGQIVFSDRSRRTLFEHEVSPLDVELIDFGTRPDDESPYSFTATTGAGESLEWQGNVSVVPFYSTGRFALTGVQPRTGWLYVQDDVFFEVVDGAVDVEGRYDLDARDELRLRLEEGEIRVRDFEVADRETGASAVAIAKFDVTEISIAYPERSIRIGEVSTRGGQHHALRLEDGAFRASQLASTRSSTGSVDAVEADESEGVGEVDAMPESDAAGGASDPDEVAADWSVVIEIVDIAEHRIEFEDRSTRPPTRLRIEPVVLRLEDVRSDLSHPFKLDLELGLEEGRVKVAGPVTLEPVHADVAIVVEAFDLRSFEAYWLPTLDVDLTSGELGVDGRVVAGLDAAAVPDVRFAGDVRLDSVRAVDRTLHANLFSWEALELNALAIETAPLSLSLEHLRLVEPSSHLVLAKDGSTNFSNVVVEQASSAEPEAAAGPAPPVSIGRVEIVRGAATFEDRTIEPRFETGISALSGQVVGLSSAKDARATIDLDGRLDGTTPVKVEGEASPFATDPYLDLSLAFENFELSPFSPYSGRHIGQSISRGKLFLDVEYVLDGSEIRGENVLFLDQFTLGEKVKSDDAIKLPVGLAVALLKDRNGEIRIDLPVRGDVDDPEFSVGKLVFGALGNLITKVALSPFAMLGGLGSSSDEQSEAVIFAGGRSDLAPLELAKLDALAAALGERPALSLELKGGAMAVVDTPALQAERLDEELRRARLRDLQARWFGDKPESIDEIVLEPDDRRALIERRYTELTGEKARALRVPPLEVSVSTGPDSGSPSVSSASNDEAAQIEAWVSQVEASLAARIDVDEGTLRELAERRSQAVRDYLVAEGGIAPERIFQLVVSVDDTSRTEQPSTALSLTAH